MHRYLGHLFSMMPGLVCLPRTHGEFDLKVVRNLANDRILLTFVQKPHVLERGLSLLKTGHANQQANTYTDRPMFNTEVYELTVKTVDLLKPHHGHIAVDVKTVVA